MLIVSNKFGGVNNRQEGHLIGPSLAVSLSNVNLNSQGIRSQKGLGSTLATGSGTLRSLYKIGATWVTSTTAWMYREYDGQVLRAAAGQTPQRSTDGTTWYNLGITAPSAPTVAQNGAGVLSGDYQYVLVYTSSLGGQSGPSDLSNTVTVASKQIDVPVTASADPQVDGIKVYRIGGTSTALRLVTTLANTTTTYTDNTADANLGTALSSDEQLFDTPPQLEGVTVTQYGVPVGWVGNTLYVGIKEQVQAWPSTYTLQFPEDIIWAGPFQGALTVLTEASVYNVTGRTGPQMLIQNTASQQGCLERDTVVDMGDALLWLSPDGICAYSAGQVEVISKGALSDAFMAGVASSNAKAARYNERYILFVQSGTSFASGGYLEYDPRTPGNWKMGTVAANACHYNRTDDALYVAVVDAVKEWEDGSDLTYSYRTGDWDADSEVLMKHFRRIALHHDGAVTVKVYVDGTQVTFNDAATSKSFTRTTPGKSVFFLPGGTRGRYLSIEVTGTGPVREVMAEVGQLARRP